MVYLRIKDILKEKGKTKYWLVKNMESNYKVVSDMIEGETIGIRFDTIEKLCKILDCNPRDIFGRSKDGK